MLVVGLSIWKKLYSKITNCIAWFQDCTEVKCKLCLTFSNITSKENPHRCYQRAKGQHETNEQPNASTLKETFYQNGFSYGRSQFNQLFKKKTKTRTDKNVCLPLKSKIRRVGRCVEYLSTVKTLAFFLLANLCILSACIYFP